VTVTATVTTTGVGIIGTGTATTDAALSPSAATTELSVELGAATKYHRRTTARVTSLIVRDRKLPAVPVSCKGDVCYWHLADISIVVVNGKPDMAIVGRNVR
jgi:hypothetical protein